LPDTIPSKTPWNRSERLRPQRVFLRTNRTLLQKFGLHNFILQPKKDIDFLTATFYYVPHMNNNNPAPWRARMPTVPLRKMQKDQSGTITAVKVGGELGRRIRDMGIVPGTRITIMGRAPLFDPVAIRIMGGTLTLRNSEADYIEVEIA
jgi:ferrous iron transport protein A